MDEILTIKRVICEEKVALRILSEAIDEKVLTLISTFDKCQGKVIFSGVGKMGNVALKVSSTFSSLGIPSMFLFPMEANHGGLGVLQKDDVVVMLSKSGETKELMEMVSYVKKMGIILVGVTCSNNSTLFTKADIAYVIPNVPEACALKLAPTCSTIMMMSLFDAIAVAISEKREISREQFLKVHPGGTIGKS